MIRRLRGALAHHTRHALAPLLLLGVATAGVQGDGLVETIVYTTLRPPGGRRESPARRGG